MFPQHFLFSQTFTRFSITCCCCCVMSQLISFIFVCFLLLCYEQVTLYCIFVAVMAFHARISDPRVGGTYLTLLNTLTNLGGNWCQTLALWLVDGLTWTNCLGATIPGLHCSSKTSAKVQAIILEMLSFCIVIFFVLCFQRKTNWY